MPWPWRRPLAPSPPASPPPPPLDLGSTKAIADLAQKEYANENTRTSVLDGKAGPLIGATGAAIAFIIGVLVKPPDSIAQRTDAPTVTYFAVVILSLVCLLIAQGHFLQSVRVRAQFRRMDLQAWVDYSAMELPEWHVQSTLAVGYRDATRVNTALNDTKATLQARGVWWLLAGTIALVVLVPGSVLWAILTKGTTIVLPLVH